MLSGKQVLFSAELELGEYKFKAAAVNLPQRGEREKMLGAIYSSCGIWQVYRIVYGTFTLIIALILNVLFTTYLPIQRYFPNQWTIQDLTNQFIFYLGSQSVAMMCN